MRSYFRSFTLIAGLFAVHATSYAQPPVLMTSSFVKTKHSLAECTQRASDIIAKMNLEREDHGNGTIVGYGEQSVASVNCHQITDTLFVQLAVASQKQEAAEAIMYYLVNYMRTIGTDTPTVSK